MATIYRMGGEASRPMMTLKEAAARWGRNEVYLRRIVARISGAVKEIEGGNVVWKIPADSAYPQLQKRGRKAR